MAGTECAAALFLVFGCTTVVSSGLYNVDTTGGLGRRFDGLGGLSGGGATSKLLVNYAEPYRSQILDYLFKPNFGASLQILKVEIGGDGQSTDGTEASHMHEPWDEAYNRGYEWWLMTEAKKRNPLIKLYGLPWTFPGWVAMATQNPFTNVSRTAHYLLKWLQGAKKYHNLDINYIGIWNERHYDKHYIKLLRQVLDQNGFSKVQIVAADSSWLVSADILKDPEFAKAVSIIGAHYPGTNSSQVAQMTNKPLWSSEDYSTFNDNVGGGCWARILNQNYVNGLMTSTISWNLIASYYQDLPFGRDGLMTAQEPWSGHYVVESPILITAHTTHFVNVGWYYLRHGSGVGHLDQGGSYVSLTDKTSGHLTIIIETMSHNHSICIRPFLPMYTVKPQTATFLLKGQFSRLTKLYVWHSRLYFDGRPDKMFVKENPAKVIEGRVTVSLDVDEIYTLTTVDRQPPDFYPQSPSSKPFPLPYRDDFEGYPVNGESFDFVPQVGVWEIRKAEDRGHGKVNRQVMLHDGCYWCNSGSQPINIGGNYNWSDILVTVDVYIPAVNGTDGVFLGARVTRGGCHSDRSSGVFFGIHQNTSTFVMSTDFKMTKVIKNGSLSGTVERNTWYRIGLVVVADKAHGFFNHKHLVTVDVSSAPTNGFVAYGAMSYGIADYDNLLISEAPGHLDLWKQRLTNGTLIGHVV